MEVDVDVRGNMLVRQRGSLKGTAAALAQPVFAVSR